ncbi:hypothetical protein ACFO25_08885 [Paenactinomyces guangxiensis]|uniref:Uncharacterized protein n=1 Tax=Paenactinomyces guangxiensis TaxID=1490290 RepID=A0A7W1WN96_9BACL|nr:hypothetical protein [Paenactinomyces guangxiensis]MBA4492839.1 hypothetical protein [Paenactinomyces guangxiensis]MBH8590312.1 hypothetical protein [Paenactinomyces guangxiensis]
MAIAILVELYKAAELEPDFGHRTFRPDPNHPQIEIGFCPGRQAIRKEG